VLADPQVAANGYLLRHPEEPRGVLTAAPLQFDRELPRLMRRYGFDWLILDLAFGESGCVQVIERLAAESPTPRVVLVDGRSQAEVDAIRRTAAQHGLNVAGVVSRPLSLPKLRQLTVQAQADDEPADDDPVFGTVSGIPSDEIVLHFQPIITMADRSVRRAEALVRWQHPQHGLIRPIHFIGVFERADMIAPLTWDVLARAVDQHVAWKREGLMLSVSVNISALFLASLRTADEVLELLRSRGCDPRHLLLEITETEAAVNPPVARDVDAPARGRRRDLHGRLRRRLLRSGTSALLPVQRSEGRSLAGRQARHQRRGAPHRGDAGVSRGA